MNEVILGLIVLTKITLTTLHFKTKYLRYKSETTEIIWLMCHVSLVIRAFNHLTTI